MFNLNKAAVCEILTDSMASLSPVARLNILTELAVSIPQVEKDSKESGDEHIRNSLEAMRTLRQCCIQAQKEYEDLSKKVSG